jgi:hypothetical protein
MFIETVSKNVLPETLKPHAAGTFRAFSKEADSEAKFQKIKGILKYLEGCPFFTEKQKFSLQ